MSRAAEIGFGPQGPQKKVAHHGGLFVLLTHNLKSPTKNQRKKVSFRTASKRRFLDKRCECNRLGLWKRATIFVKTRKRGVARFARKLTKMSALERLSGQLFAESVVAGLRPISELGICRLVVVSCGASLSMALKVGTPLHFPQLWIAEVSTDVDLHQAPK